MRNTSIILLVFLFSSCIQNSADNTNQTEVIDENYNDSSVEILYNSKSLRWYIHRPKHTDTMCIKDIAAAKRDIENGEIFFGTRSVRQEKYLKLLCEKHNLILMPVLPRCITYKGQTEGCYIAYMDYTMKQKFGEGFKERLLQEADSMLLASNDTIMYNHCDIEPEIYGKHRDGEITLEAKVPISIKKLLKADDDDYPFMDISFYINKSGKASGYFLYYYFDANNESNNAFKEQLFKIGVEQLKKIKRWVPGSIKGQKVISEFNVRVYF